MLVTGKVERVTQRDAGNPGNTWVEHTIVVADWGRTLFVTASKALIESGLPEEGEMVALDVFARGFVNKKGEAGVGFTGTARNAEAEAALYAAERVSGVRAVV